MANKKQLQELNKLLADLEVKYKSLNRISPFKDKDAKELVKSYGSVAAATKTVETSMKGIRADILEINTGLDGVKESFNDIAKELGNIDNPLKNMSKGFKKIRNFAEELSDIQYDLTKSSVKQTRSLQSKVNLEFQRLTRETKSLQNQIKSGKLTGKELTDAQELLAFAKDEAQTLEEKVGHQEKFNKSLEATVNAQKNINKATGLTGKAISGMAGFAEKIGFGDLSQPLTDIKNEMNEHAVILTNNGDKAATLGDQFRVMGTGLMGLGKALYDAISDPLVIVTMLVKAVQFLANIFDHVLKLTNKVGQSLGIAGKNAQYMKEQIHQAGDASADGLFYFTDELVDGYITLNKAAGVQLKFNKENVRTFQDMTLYMGLSKEQATGLFNIATQTGVPFNEIYDNVADTVNELDKASNTSSDMGAVMEAITQSSGKVRFNVKGGVDGLVKAAHTAARLGMSMDEIAAAAESHLDFESSIAKEIEAEMFLQKDLNLDKLRYAALTGDVATQAAEEERLIKENAAALKGNVLAQQAFSEATGISMDKLGGALSNQERLAKLSPKQLKMEKDKTAEMVKQGQDAVAFDRSMERMMRSLKAALEPIAKIVGPMLIKGATFVANFLQTKAGKTMLMIAGLAAGGVLLAKASKGIMGFFSSAFSSMTKQGATPVNPNYVYVVNQQGGGGMDFNLGKGLKGNIFKYLGKNGGGLTRTFQRAGLKAFGKGRFGKMLYNGIGKLGTNKIMTSIGKPVTQVMSKVIPSSFSNLTKNFGTNNMAKIAKSGASGNTRAFAMASKYTNPLAFAPKTAGAAPTSVVGKATNLAAKGGSKVISGITKAAKVLGPIGAVADLVVGGFTGSAQADMSASEQKEAGVKEGIGKGEATVQGVLTGGAEKGSMFTEMLGGEKGSAGDEALGIGMAAGRGALTGAAIGSVIPVVGTAVGAAVGAVVGTVSEGFKVFSDPNSSLRQGITDFASGTADTISGWASSAGSSISGWASSAGSTLLEWDAGAKEAISSFASSAGEQLSEWGTTATEGFTEFNKFAGEGITSLANGTKEIASQAGEYAMSTLSSIGSSIADSSVGQAVGGAVDSFKESNWNPGNWFAEGGIVTQPMIGGVGEAGPEAIIPLNQAGNVLGTNEITTLLKELIKVVKSGGDVYLDGSKVGHTLALQSSRMG